jgi:hypothetical protein
MEEIAGKCAIGKIGAHLYVDICACPIPFLLATEKVYESVVEFWGGEQ